jgi:hypothetical protein
MTEEKEKYGPASETQKMFLQNKSKFCIYGGGEQTPPLKNNSLIRWNSLK